MASAVAVITTRSRGQAKGLSTVSRVTGLGLGETRSCPDTQSQKLRPGRAASLWQAKRHELVYGLALARRRGTRGHVDISSITQLKSMSLMALPLRDAGEPLGLSTGPLAWAGAAMQEVAVLAGDGKSVGARPIRGHGISEAARGLANGSWSRAGGLGGVWRPRIRVGGRRGKRGRRGLVKDRLRP
jgi:hypothetical protein